MKQETCLKFSKLLIVLLLAFALVACGDESTPTPAAPSGGLLPFPTPASNRQIGYASETVAVVNGLEITTKDFNQSLDQIRVTSEEQAGGTIDWDKDENKARLKEIREQVLEGLINFTVISQEAAREGVTVTDAEISQQIEEFKKQIGGEKSYSIWLSRRFINDTDYRRIVAQGLLFGKMEDKHSPVEDKGEQVKVRHILLATEREAKDIYQKVLQGADFAAMARQFSLDSVSAQKGGELDWIFRDSTETPFQKSAFALKAGDISGPIKTDLGWHIIQSVAKEVRPLPFDLVAQRKTDSFTTYVKTLRDKAKIEKFLK